MLVKICGLTEEGAALAAVEAGADFLGFVFAPSRRRLEPASARAIIAAVREKSGPDRVRAVGVFVDEPAERVDEVAAYCGLDYVQLNGDEDPAYVRRLAMPAIVARAASASLTSEALAAFAEAAALYLVDAYSPTERGGTGRRCDWAVAANLAATLPIVLAGGLTPENVAAAIAAVRPCGVDVSSGVETDGRKDPAKIAAFVRRAREAEAQLAGLPAGNLPSPYGRPTRTRTAVQSRSPLQGGAGRPIWSAAACRRFRQQLVGQGGGKPPPAKAQASLRTPEPETGTGGTTACC